MTAPTPHPEDQPVKLVAWCEVHDANAGTCGCPEGEYERVHDECPTAGGVCIAHQRRLDEGMEYGHRWLPFEPVARPVSQGTEDSPAFRSDAENLNPASGDASQPERQDSPDVRERIAFACWNVGAGTNADKWADAAMTAVSPLVEQLRQARATAESISKRTDMFKQAYNRMAKHAAGLAAERDRLRLAWQSAARGRMRARIERDTLGECMPCTLCDDTGIAPEERFGRDTDGAPMVDGDQPCPEGCPVRRDIAYLQDAVAEYDRHAPACLRERGQLRADLETRTRERDELTERVETQREAIQGWVAYKVRVVQQRRELADRFIAALGLAHPEPLQALPELVAELRESRFRWAEEAARLESERDYLAWLHAEAAHLLASFLTVQCSSVVDGVRALVARCDAAELEWRTARDVAARAFVFPQGWERQVVAVIGDLAGRDFGRLLAAWRAAPVVESEAADGPSPAPKSPQTATRDEVVEEWAATWDGVDRSGLPDAPTALKLPKDYSLADLTMDADDHARHAAERDCIACRQMYAWYGDEALSLIPADHVHAPAVKGVDCGWAEKWHPVASPGTGTETGE